MTRTTNRGVAAPGACGLAAGAPFLAKLRRRSLLLAEREPAFSFAVPAQPETLGEPALQIAPEEQARVPIA